MRRDILYIFLCILIFSMTSCVDDWFERPESIGEGKSTVSATVDFRPMASGLTQGTRAAGDAIKAIETLYVLLYDENGNLAEGQSDTVAKNIMCYSTYIFRNNVAATFDECIRTSS